ncbi:MAG: hypothetical protein ACRDQA_18065 [Nocardioidaceae bacterium]
MGVNFRVGLPGPFSYSKRLGGQSKSRQRALQNASPRDLMEAGAIVLAVVGLITVFVYTAFGIVMFVLAAGLVGWAIYTRTDRAAASAELRAERKRSERLDKDHEAAQKAQARRERIESLKEAKRSR